MQSFMPLTFSTTEKSVTVHTSKQKTHSKLSIPILPYGGIVINISHSLTHIMAENSWHTCSAVWRDYVTVTIYV